jgi:hypothetical protein
VVTLGEVFTLGPADGIALGEVDGTSDGIPLGPIDGLALGEVDGTSDGIPLGPADGLALGEVDGIRDGVALGVMDDIALGEVDGISDGTIDGPWEWRSTEPAVSKVTAVRAIAQPAFTWECAQNVMADPARMEPSTTLLAPRVAAVL